MVGGGKIGRIAACHSDRGAKYCYKVSAGSSKDYSEDAAKRSYKMCHSVGLNFSRSQNFRFAI